MKHPLSVLLYAYGNPGRQDDGLGNAFIDSIEKWIKSEGLDNIETDSNYQLNIEDAELISSKDIVIFIDASMEGIEDIALTTVDPEDARIEFTMHAVSPAFVLDLCRKLFNHIPETYLLHIKGYEWEFREALTDKARENLDKALDMMKRILKDPQSIKNAVS